MMMKILEAGGMAILTDNQRSADEDNPKGYYELERVKKLKEGDIQWVDEAQGKVVKVISPLLEYLPQRHRYKIIFMRRELNEILASQHQMLIRRGESDDAEDARLTENFQEHLKRVRVWLANQSNIDVLYIDYNQLMQDAGPSIQALQRFLDLPLDVEAMVSVPDATLYRQRSK